MGLDHLDGRSWRGLHRNALMTMIAHAFLQHGAWSRPQEKKRITDRRGRPCLRSAQPSSGQPPGITAANLRPPPKSHLQTDSLILLK